MKRIAVLFGIIALTTVCATTFAEAPSIGDLPALRMVPNTGTVTPLLDQQLMDAYDAFDYIKDANDDIDGLTISVISVDPIPAPKAASAAAGTAPTVEVTVDTVAETALVDVYGFASPAWFSYVVDVADASTVSEGVNVRSTAIAKYSTFAFDGPSIDSGRIIGDLLVDPQRFTYFYSEGTLNIASLMDNITPADASAAISWSAFVNSVSREFDVNGSYLGLDKTYMGDADEGGSVTVDDVMFQVDADGGLTLTAGASIGMGPWLVGILATDDADDNNADGARVMVARSLLATVTSTYGGSETFDDLPLGTISVISPNITVDENGTATGVADPLDYVIGENSYWRYQGLGMDTIINMVPLSVVDIASDGAPAAVPGVASGRALKATFQPATSLGPVDLANPSYPRADGFRLVGGFFGPTELGDVYTFSASIATDAADDYSAPEFLIAMSSAAGGTLTGGQFSITRGIDAVLPLLDDQQIPVPVDGEGWGILSCNYTPGATNAFFGDVNGDSVIDEQDDALIASVLLEPLGATESINEKDYFFANLLMWASTEATSAVNVWLDNMRVYKSAYELDLALGPQELDPIAQSDPVYDSMITAGFITPPSGWDGSIDSYTDTGDLEADLSDIGWVVNNTVAQRAWPFMPASFLWGASDLTSVGVANYDHTLNGSGTGHSLVVTLSGTDAEKTAVRFELQGAPMLATGTGLYALEAYVSSGGPYNQGGSTPNMPGLKIIMNEMAPNAFGNSFGDVLVGAGLPQSVAGEVPDNWRRTVATMYVENAHMLRAMVQVEGSFAGDVANYDLPMYLDDFKIYKVTDNVDYFDAELFDI